VVAQAAAVTVGSTAVVISIGGELSRRGGFLSV
jgi:hypothetical protein